MRSASAIIPILGIILSWVGANHKMTMKLFDLSGKVAVVTGSSRGLGYAIAEAMVAHGRR